MKSESKIVTLFAACGFCLLVLLLSCSEEPTNSSTPTLQVEPTSLHRTTVCNRPIGRSEIDVRGIGEEGITFTAMSSATWLTLTNASGATPGTIFVNFGVGSFDVGVYVDTIVITSLQAINSPQFVEVTLTIASEIKVSSDSLNFLGLRSGANPQPQKIVITDTCETGFSYTLSESASWLALSPESGTAPDTVTVSVDIAGLPIGIFTEIITIDAPQAANSPRGVPCTLVMSSWGQQENPIQQDLRGVTFVDEYRGWAVGIDNNFPERMGFIITTVDGGQHWVPQRVAVDSGLGDVAFVDASTGWTVGVGGYIVHTSNGGNSWTSQTSGTTKDLWGVTFIDPDTGWAVGRDGVVLHTTNGGDNWNEQSSSTTAPLSQVAFVDSRYGWAVGNAGTIIYTNAGGDNWTNQVSGTGSNLRDVYFTDRDTGWVVGSEGTVLHTTDGGDTWLPQLVSTDNQLNGIAFSSVGQGWAVGGNGTILYTTDGESWSVQVSGMTKDLFDVHFFDENIGWAVGEKGLIIHTLSGGN